ncbi:MAG: hypothetical protein NVS4B11_16590 [Ktedonobacteraceae bacterium]
MIRYDPFRDSTHRHAMLSFEHTYAIISHTGMYLYVLQMVHSIMHFFKGLSARISTPEFLLPFLNMLLTRYVTVETTSWVAVKILCYCRRSGIVDTLHTYTAEAQQAFAYAHEEALHNVRL